LFFSLVPKLIKLKGKLLKGSRAAEKEVSKIYFYSPHAGRAQKPHKYFTSPQLFLAKILFFGRAPHMLAAGYPSHLSSLGYTY
jgi:hypothetical protein